MTQTFAFLKRRWRARAGSTQDIPQPLPPSIHPARCAGAYALSLQGTERTYGQASTQGQEPGSASFKFAKLMVTQPNSAIWNAISAGVGLIHLDYPRFFKRSSMVRVRRRRLPVSPAASGAAMVDDQPHAYGVIGVTCCSKGGDRTGGFQGDELLPGRPWPTGFGCFASNSRTTGSVCSTAFTG